LLLSRVRLEADSGELLGHGKVRYCRSAGANHIVGIEFTDSLYWRAPEGPITEPIPLSAPQGEEESRALPGVATTLTEELLWSDAPDGKRPASTGSFMPPVPELHLSLDSRANEGFFARLPMAIKAGAPVLMALALGSFLLGNGHITSGSNAGDATASIVGEQGWVTEWASDTVGSRRGRQITIYRPSRSVSDYP